MLRDVLREFVLELKDPASILEVEGQEDHRGGQHHDVRILLYQLSKRNVCYISYTTKSDELDDDIDKVKEGGGNGQSEIKF